VLDFSSGLFLCQECSNAYVNDPNAPQKETYTLQLVDNTRDLKLAMDNLRRSNVQLSAKSIGNQQLRAGIYDLLQKVRGSKGGKYSAAAQPITSNLPSENFALGIGSKRLAGTGRTVGIKVKKLEQQGVVESAAQARNYLVGGGDGARGTDEGDFLFLKNAMGHEMQFTVERGGGARAQLLATRRRRRRKLMDAAASRVGASLPLYLQVAEARRRRQEAELAKQKDGKNKTNTNLTLDFLLDNIGRNGKTDTTAATSSVPDDVSLEEYSDMEPELILVDELDEVRKLPEDMRLASFQAQYKVEVDRQVKLLEVDEMEAPGSPLRTSMEDEDRAVVWEDGGYE
jgi:hypothetical protein